MDKESLRKEKQRQSYEQLRARPRPKHDASSMWAIFAPGQETVEQGASRFVKLLEKIVDQNRYVEQWREVRTPEDHDRATGLNPIENPEAYLEYVLGEGENDDSFYFSMLAFSRKIYPDDPRTYSAQMNYEGGKQSLRFDSLFFGCNEPDGAGDHNLTLQEYLALIRTVVAWREPRLITVGNSYATHDRVFWHRAWDGWIGWFPHEISPSLLPDFALTWRIGNGTAVATQETNVLSRYPDQRQRANEVEMALTDAGILPTEDEVKGFR